MPAPEAVNQAICDILKEEESTFVHGYMSNAGYEDVRDTIARSLNRRFGTSFHQNNILMTVGAASGMNVILKTILDPGDEVYRRIIMAGKGFTDADEQAPLYLHTTEEMMEEFSYLGTAKAHEVVIENPNKIADMIEKISPVRPDKCPPVIDNSDQQLRDICYKKAHEMYGENLPDVVTERLERELHSIISNGFAVMYIIAQKLVWKSNEDGYLVLP